MSWEQAAKRAKEVQSDGKYLTLKDDGDNATVAVIGEPVEFKRAFVDGKYITDPAAIAQSGAKPQTRFRITVWRPGSSEPQTFEATAKVVEDIAKHASQLGTHLFKLTRFGAAKSTGTFYTFEPERAMTAEELASLSAPSVPAPATGASALPF